MSAHANFLLQMLASAVIIAAVVGAVIYLIRRGKRK